MIEKDLKKKNDRIKVMQLQIDEARVHSLDAQDEVSRLQEALKDAAPASDDAATNNPTKLVSSVELNRGSEPDSERGQAQTPPHLIDTSDNDFDDSTDDEVPTSPKAKKSKKVSKKEKKKKKKQKSPKSPKASKQKVKSVDEPVVDEPNNDHVNVVLATGSNPEANDMRPSKVPANQQGSSVDGAIAREDKADYQTGDKQPTLKRAHRGVDTVAKSKESFEETFEGVVRWLCDTELSEDDFDEPSLEALVNLSKLPTPREIEASDEIRIFNISMEWIRKHRPNPFKIDEPSIRSLANLAGVPLPQNLASGTKKKALDDSWDCFRKQSPNVEDVDEATMEVLANVAGIPTRRRLVAADKSQLFERAMKVIRAQTPSQENLGYSELRHLAVLAGIHMPENILAPSKGKVDETRQLKDRSDTEKRKGKRERNAVSGPDESSAVALRNCIDNLLARDLNESDLDDTQLSALVNLAGLPGARDIPSSTKSSVVKECMQKISANDPDADRLDESSIRTLADLIGMRLPKNLGADAKKETVNAIISSFRTNKVSDEEFNDVATEALVNLCGLSTPRRIARADRRQVLDIAIDVIRKGAAISNSLDDVSVRSLLDLEFGTRSAPGGKSSILTAEIDVQNSPRDSQESPTNMMEDPLSALGGGLGASNFDAVVDWLRSHKPGEEDIDDAALEMLANLAGIPGPRDIPPSQKSEVLDASIKWIQKHDPNPDEVDESTLRTLANLAGVELQSKTKALEDILVWLRKTTLDENELDGDVVEALANLAGIPTPRNIPKSEKIYILNTALTWIRCNEPNPQNVDDSGLEALAKLACVSFPHADGTRRRTHKKEEERLLRISFKKDRQKAFDQTVDWLRTNDPKEDEVSSPALEALANLAAIPGHRKISKVERPKVVRFAIQLIQEKDPRPDYVDDHTLQSLASLANIPLQTKEKALSETVSILRKTTLTPEQVDHPALEALANVAKVPTRRQKAISRTQRSVMLYQVMDYVRDNDRNKTELESPSQKALTTLAAAVAKDRNAPSLKHNRWDTKDKAIDDFAQDNHKSVPEKISVDDSFSPVTAKAPDIRLPSINITETTAVGSIVSTNTKNGSSCNSFDDSGTDSSENIKRGNPDTLLRDCVDKLLSFAPSESDIADAQLEAIANLAGYSGPRNISSSMRSAVLDDCMQQILDRIPDCNKIDEASIRVLADLTDVKLPSKLKSSGSKRTKAVQEIAFSLRMNGLPGDITDAAVGALANLTGVQTPRIIPQAARRGVLEDSMELLRQGNIDLEIQNDLTVRNLTELVVGLGDRGFFASEGIRAFDEQKSSTETREARLRDCVDKLRSRTPSYCDVDDQQLEAIANLAGLCGPRDILSSMKSAIIYDCMQQINACVPSFENVDEASIRVLADLTDVKLSSKLNKSESKKKKAVHEIVLNLRKKGLPLDATDAAVGALANLTSVPTRRLIPTSGRQEVFDGAMDLIRQGKYNLLYMDDRAVNALAKISGSPDAQNSEPFGLLHKDSDNGACNFGAMVDWLRSHKPGEEDIDDSALETLVNLAGLPGPREIAKSEKSKVLESCMQWIQLNDPVPDEVDDLTLRTLAKLAGVELQTRDKALNDILAWLRSTKLDEKDLNEGCIEALANLARVPTRRQIPESERLKVLVGAYAWIRRHDPNPRNVDDYGLQALAKLASVSFPHMSHAENPSVRILDGKRMPDTIALQRSESFKHNRQKAFDETVDWLRCNEPHGDEVDHPALEALANLTELSGHRNISGSERANVFEASMTRLQKEDPQLNDVDENTLQSLAGLAKIPLQTKEKVLGDTMSSLRRKKLTADQVDHTALEALANVAKIPTRRQKAISKKQKQVILGDVMDYVRDTRLDKQDLDSSSQEALTTLATAARRRNVPVFVPAQPPNSKTMDIADLDEEELQHLRQRCIRIMEAEEARRKLLEEGNSDINNVQWSDFVTLQEAELIKREYGWELPEWCKRNVLKQTELGQIAKEKGDLSEKVSKRSSYVANKNAPEWLATPVLRKANTNDKVTVRAKRFDGNHVSARAGNSKAYGAAPICAANPPPRKPIAEPIAEKIVGAKVPLDKVPVLATKVSLRRPSATLNTANTTETTADNGNEQSEYSRLLKSPPKSLKPPSKQTSSGIVYDSPIVQALSTGRPTPTPAPSAKQEVFTANSVTPAWAANSVLRKTKKQIIVKVDQPEDGDAEAQSTMEKEEPVTSSTAEAFPGELLLKPPMSSTPSWIAQSPLRKTRTVDGATAGKRLRDQLSKPEWAKKK
jgi:hypothetical protein